MLFSIDLSQRMPILFLNQCNWSNIDALKVKNHFLNIFFSFHLVLNRPINFWLVEVYLKVERKVLGFDLVDIGVSELIYRVSCDLDPWVMAFLEVWFCRNHAMIIVKFHMIRVFVIVIGDSQCLYFKNRE